MADAAVLPADPALALKRARQGKSCWRRVRERLRDDKVTLAVIGVLVIPLVMVVFAHWFTVHDPYTGSVLQRLKPVGTPGHWLGTDEVGRDLWSRMVYGGRLSLLVPVFMALLIGGFLGLLAGYAGGLVNSAIMRVTDVLYAFPSILLAIAITGILGSRLRNTILALTISFIPPVIRISESVTTQVRHLDFVEAAHARGELAALIVESTERIISDSQMSADSARRFRTGRRDIEAHHDGVTVDTAGLLPLMTVTAKLLPDMDAKSADRYWLSMTRDTQLATAPLLGVTLVRDRLDMHLAMEAGRAWQRLHLGATAEGLAAQPLNQPVECIDRSAMGGKNDSFGPAIVKLAATPGWEPTFVFRLGVAERPASQSPRRALSEVLR